MNLLLELLLRASLLIMAGLCLWALARNRSAESRVTLLRGTLAGLALLPALWAVGPRWAFNVPGLAKPDPIVVDFDLDVLALTQQPVGPSRVDLLPFVYLGIALLVLVPALIGHFILRRVWNQAKPLGWQLEDELSEALDTVGVHQKVEGRVGGLGSPLVFGSVNRRILLPESFLAWPEEHRRSALLHEAAHLKRFDCAWQHLAHGVRAVYWCHPLVWFLSRALKDETELAADERAIRSGAEAADYASALVAIARTLQEPGRLVRSQGVTFMNHRQLDRRVRSVLYGRRRGFSSLGSLAMAGLAALGTYLAAGANPQKPSPDVVIAQRPATFETVAPLPRSVPQVGIVRDLQKLERAAKTSRAVSGIAIVSTGPIRLSPSQVARVQRAPMAPSATVAPRAAVRAAEIARTAPNSVAPRAVQDVAVVQGKIAPLSGTPSIATSPREALAPLSPSGTVDRALAAPRAPTRIQTDPFKAPGSWVAPAQAGISTTKGEALFAPSSVSTRSLQGEALRYREAAAGSLLQSRQSAASQAELRRAVEQMERLHKESGREIEGLKKLLETSRADDAKATELLRDLNLAKPVDSMTYRFSGQRNKGFESFSGARSYSINTKGTKPVTLTVTVDGKRHNLKVTPDKDGNVRIEVDEKGSVRAIGG